MKLNFTQDDVRPDIAYVISYMLGVGEARGICRKILDEDIFDDISKHNSYFQHTDEKTADKLEDIRWALNRIHDALYDILGKIDAPDFEA